MKRFAGIYTPIVTPFPIRRHASTKRALRRNVARWMATPLTGLVVLGSNGEAAQLDDDEADRVVEIVRERRAARSAADRRHRPRVHARDDRGDRARRGRRRRRGARAHAVVLQAADDDRRVRPPLHGGRRRLAGAGAALQRDDVHRRQPAARCGRAAGRASEHRRHEGIGERHRHRSPSTSRARRTTSPCSPARRRRSFTRCAPGATARFSRWPRCCRTSACAMQALVREHRLDEARALQHRLMPLARSVGGTYGVPGLKAALDLIGYTGGLPRPPLRPARSRRRRHHSRPARRARACIPTGQSHATEPPCRCLDKIDVLTRIRDSCHFPRLNVFCSAPARA